MIRISRRSSIFPPAVVLASVLAMFAPAAPADGKTTLGKLHGLDGVFGRRIPAAVFAERPKS
ncbi:hypothetical protein [Microbispora corallina]|uniref:hypothetical protein n=1 Tax=Microbispora corallina TaxID=83302 RepID=UPI0019524E50|nr:hypothetical protein [Microbispora corallina]